MDLGTVRVYEADPVLIVVLDEAELRIVFTVTRDVEVAFIYQERLPVLLKVVSRISRIGVQGSQRAVVKVDLSKPIVKAISVVFVRRFLVNGTTRVYIVVVCQRLTGFSTLMVGELEKQGSLIIAEGEETTDGSIPDG